MSENEKKSKKEGQSNLNQSNVNIKENQSKNSCNSKSLIGNKRERTKTDEDIGEQNKKCIYCNIMNSNELFILDENSQNQKIINYINQKIKDEQFIKKFKTYMEKIYQNSDIKKNNFICSDCFLDNFIKGGVNQIFLEKKDDKDNNSIAKDIIDNDQKKKLKEIVDIYSININLAIKSLKELKMKYSKIIKTTKELLENTALRIMLSRNHEFPDFKQKTDNCKQNLEDIEEIFDTIINDLTKKEELKTFIIEGVFTNDNSTKNNLLKILKQVQNEIEFSTINIIGGGKKIKGNETDKNNDVTQDSLLDIPKNKPKENNEKNNNTNNNNNSNNKNNVQNNINNINTNNLLNLQNQKKQNINEQLLLNNLDKADILKNNLFLPQNNYLQDFPFLRPGLGLFPSLGSQIGHVPNNILINNLFPSPSLNPQYIEQINNSQINSIFPNTDNNINNNNNPNANLNNNINTNISNNDNNKKINNNLSNINNIQFPGINGLLPRPNFPFNNSVESLKEIENLNLLSMKNIINNPSNIINNNLYNTHPLNLSPLPFTNLSSNPSPLLSHSLGLGSPSLYNNILNFQGNNDLSNNGIDQNKLNNLNLMNRERNLINQNTNKGVNTNNMNNRNNISNIQTLNNLNGYNNLNNPNLNNSNNIYLNTNDEKKLLNLFDKVAEMKYSKNDNYLNYKNNNANNINIQTDITNNNEQINLPQTNLESSDIGTAPININENNNINNINNNISEQNINAENNINNNNILKQKNVNDGNNEKEELNKGI